MSFNCNSGSKHETQEASHVQGLDQILLVLSALCGHKSTYQSIGAMLLLPSSDDVHLCWWKGKMLQDSATSACSVMVFGSPPKNTLWLPMLPTTRTLCTDVLV